ncbi:MAG: cation acetate symporter, partial [Planctomycetaceae bacterium]
MIYEPSTIAVVTFIVFVGITLGLSFYLGKRVRSSEGFFAAHGQIPWFVNGVAFAGDYLSAASFLGICGMIAFYGYDGFLYSIGFLAGWIVALFVIAEPMKRLGKFTFADALDAKFQSRGIKLVAGISTLAVSIFYLIPQMVGAGVLIRPLLDFPHWAGVAIVGTTVILIVVSAGMVSTTWVQFIKGSLLVVFSAVLTVMLLDRGFTTVQDDADGHVFQEVGPVDLAAIDTSLAGLSELAGHTLVQHEQPAANTDTPHIILLKSPQGRVQAWSSIQRDGQSFLAEGQTIEKRDGVTYINGAPKGDTRGENELHPVGHLSKLPGGKTRTGPVGPLEFFRILQDSEVILWGNKKITTPDSRTVTVYYQKPTAGKDVLLPGTHPKFKGIHSDKVVDKCNFLSLMLALFCGTASLPHILIRYYTVKDSASARKSTIVGIGSIGFFYVLTLYMGLGAMTSGALDVTDSNMAAPLLAKSLSEPLFAIISAIAFVVGLLKRLDFVKRWK